MTKLIYVGPHDGVEVDLPGGGLLECKRDEVVEVDDAALAKQLLEQDVWEAAKGKKEGD